MRRAFTTPIFLIVVGIASAVTTLIAGIGGSNIDELVTAFMLIIDGGLIATGALWLSRRRMGSSLYVRVPAGTIMLLGLGSIVGGLLAFNAWKPSFNQAFRVLLTGVSILVGSGFITAGWLWARRRQMQYPLALLIGGLIPGTAYIAHQRLDLYVPTPVTAFLVVLSVLLAIVAVYAVPSPPLNLSES